MCAHDSFDDEFPFSNWLLMGLPNLVQMLCWHGVFERKPGIGDICQKGCRYHQSHLQKMKNGIKLFKIAKWKRATGFWVQGIEIDAAVSLEICTWQMS